MCFDVGRQSRRSVETEDKLAKWGKNRRQVDRAADMAADMAPKKWAE